MKFGVFLDVAPSSHVEVDERFRGAYCLHHYSNSVCTSEMSVNFNVTTQRYIPEDSKLQPSHCFFKEGKACQNNTHQGPSP
jgi:hypothetical protein